MLPKSQRLNLKKDFKWVAAGKRIESKFLTLFIKTNDNVFPKIGIATSGKVFKKAHQRNRARRLVSQAFQAIYTKLPASPDASLAESRRASRGGPPTINIVALPKEGIISVKSNDVLLDLEQALKYEKIID